MSLPPLQRRTETPDDLLALNLLVRQTATVPVAIAKFAEEHEVRHGEMAAGAVLSILPALIFLLVGRSDIVRGLTAGAVRSSR
jgi:multiple sugar transport system permease protein